MLCYLLQPPPLLLLLLDALLPLCQELPLVLLLLPHLLLLEELLVTHGLGALLVLLLQADEVASQGGLGCVDDGAGGSERIFKRPSHLSWSSMPAPHTIPRFSFLLWRILLLILTATVLVLRLICAWIHTRLSSTHFPLKHKRCCVGRTFLAPLLLGPVDVVLELDAHLPLVGLVSDERVLQQLVCGGPLHVILHQTALDEAEKLLGPALP